MKKMSIVLFSCMIFSAVHFALAEDKPAGQLPSMFQLVFRAGGDLGLSYKLQGEYSVQKSDSSSSTGSSSSTKADTFYTAKDKGSGLGIDVGFLWNPDFLFGVDTSWKGRSILQGGISGTYRYIVSSDSNVQIMGGMLDMSLLWVAEFYVGAAYASFSDPLPYVASWSGTTPVLAKKKMSGVGLILGGGLDIPVYNNFGAFLFFDYFEPQVPGDKNYSRYDYYSWARVDMRFGVTYRLDL
jgi:opacity protein-like surface antigen